LTGNRFLTVVIILLLLPVLPAFSVTDDILNYSEGSYNHELLIKINQEFPGSGEIYYSFDPDIDIPDVPYKGGFLLSALKGEERLYNIKISASGQNYNYSFLIDRKTPEVPEAVYVTNENGESGYSFSNYSANHNIYYGYDEYMKGAVSLWNGELLSIPKSGFVFFYAEDEAGNESNRELLYQRVTQSRNSRSRLEIKSPVAGVFANPQLIYIEEAGYEWIRYTLNGLDPVTSGAEYTEPVEIRRYGSVNLKIAAKPLNSESIINEEINYRVNTRAPLKNIPSSGVYSTGINIKSNFEDFRYCLEEREPLENDHVFREKLTINPIFGGVKYIAFRIKDFNSEGESEFRYFYVIDDRYPASPVISIDRKLPANNDVTVSITGPVYSDIYYTIDGSTPSAASNLYDKSFKLEVPVNRDAGSYIIKARAISLNNKSSEVITKLVTYDTKAPEIPLVTIAEIEGNYRLNYKIQDAEKLFYCSGDDLDCFTEIDSDSFYLDVPDGMEKEFSFRFLTIDGADNRSEISEPVIVNLDRKPPEPAEVRLSDGLVIIESDDAAEYDYMLYENGIILENGRDYYSSPLDLFKDADAGTNLKLNVRTIDSSGNMTLSNYSIYPFEPASSSETFLFNSRNQNIYSGDSVTFHAYPDGIADELYYYLTKTSAGGDEITEGPFSTEGEIVVNGSADSTDNYLLEVYSVNKDSEKRSKVSSNNFIIDNEKPALPNISGIINNTVSSGRIVVSPDIDDDSRIFLVYSESEESLPSVFSSSSIIFNRQIVFDAAEGERKDYFLKVGAEDSAGNRIINEQLYNFTVDKQRPEMKLIVEEDGEKADRIRISSAASESLKYYYEKGAKGSIIKEPGLDSEYFTDELFIDGRDGQEESVVVKIIAYDDAGNPALYPEYYYFNFDRKSPEIPAEPETVLIKDMRKLFVSWNKHEDDRIFYSISNIVNDETADFSEYDSPFSVKYSGAEELIAVKYFHQDDNGNRSGTSELIVRIPNVINTELVEGVKDNSFYNEDLFLTKLPEKKIIRYEIRTGEILPPEVTVFSPLLPDKLEFKTEEGESIDFLVSLKEFQNNQDVTGGAEQVIRFTIDKQPPAPPEIAGITNKEYYLSDQSVHFKGSEGTVFYNVSSVGDSGSDFKKFSEAFDIASPEGTYRSFLISAYSQDYSGNRSTISEWSITIDKEIIYVSPDGQDYSEGTRSRPYRSINKAVEQVKNSDRKTIFVASGNYFISSPVIIDESITIYGGFNSNNWFEKEGETLIKVADNFKSGNPVFYVYGGDLNINEVRVESRQNTFDSLFYINKGNLNINNTKISADCSSGNNLIRQNYGNLYINNSEINGTASSAPFISIDYGLVTINNSTVEAEASSEFLVLIEVENSINVTLTGSVIKPGRGNLITAIRLKNSNVNMKNNEIDCGRGTVSANAVEIINSKLKMNYCRITANNENRITGGIYSEDSQLDLKSNNFHFQGKNGIIGFNITGGDSLISNNKITSDACSDFSYLYLFDGGKHSVETNIADLTSGAETIVLRARDADIDFLQNTLVVYGGKERLIVFYPNENSVSRIINNIIINRKSEDDMNSSVVYLAEKNMLSLKNNCFSGWTHLISGAQSADDMISLDLLDGIYSGGQFSNNFDEVFDDQFTSADGYHLTSESICIDSGYDLSAIINEGRDFDGEKRPNPLLNRDPAFDIGADEYYE